MKGIRIIENAKEIKIKGVLGELESKKGFQRETVTKRLKLTLVFMRSSTLQEKFNSVFQELFASINKFFNLVGRLGTRLSFYEV